MKRTFILSLLAITICLVWLIGYYYNPQESPVPDSGSVNATHDAPAKVPPGGIIEIKEKMFVAQVNDVYINTEDYLGKTIKYEGIFKPVHWKSEDSTYYFVIRYGPGCCGYDGEIGFEVSWGGEALKDGAWCEVVGVLEAYEKSGGKYLRLALTSLTALAARGSEFVYQ